MSDKIWDRDAIHQLLETNPAALARAVLAIYARQTAGEKNAKTTTDANGRGFGSADAEFLSDIAMKLPRYQNRMTERQRAKVLPKMKRYWRQLLEEIEGKGGAVSYKAPRAVAVVTKAVKREIVNSSSAPSRGELARQF